ncbi:MAG: helix-turn-helix domain-containing protein, partial [Bacteroidales bacterium]
RELAKYLSCNIQTIYRLKRDKKIPYRKYGRKYYYLRSEIDKAFAGKGGRK